jgi:hypothetical protein
MYLLNKLLSNYNISKDVVVEMIIIPSKLNPFILKGREMFSATFGE